MKKILVVDDEEDIREMLKSMLSDTGYDVILASDGKDALRKVYLMKPDLILLDISMPEIDGSEVCFELKKKEATKQIPVIIMTAMSDKDGQFAGMRMIGGYPTFAKPFDWEELLGTIREILSTGKK
ncbi:MAG: hypothetical protein A3G33_00940 [Omnitrophica bacterium RIFCSPLOWO2_12_FULL_44_17]|uniref:Response regulatory domain-containing protein n=1 Tax=Candidatus Danuiimicrobium aquiferis TaxID=1801832 RepID=A0A1G1L2T0_9BACT|nr:MAG: hypothetical protein A3B72_06490 [Omnitrophica bacterium RIFCSPHIGHO2_02_FULL_45_28]OGW89660.1 MAG: hypothetical protein A3E74_04680 [Omnitrophica bacterium RIFCSPHIGHO2_12_FULL_44_12]OGW99470.1 MAG: hypothetical protein A3G33_00940 [Omnitrophica bacterium RIFCSPLOWO2_12_FULL_44_17]OGX04306.1 MAG: hypothetical protein A3J12_00650 [Omnitrophica bacterium RIFCSPLOWO2_02_FULL_44_11]